MPRSGIRQADPGTASPTKDGKGFGRYQRSAASHLCATRRTSGRAFVGQPVAREALSLSRRRRDQSCPGRGRSPATTAKPSESGYAQCVATLNPRRATKLQAGRAILFANSSRCIAAGRECHSFARERRGATGRQATRATVSSDSSCCPAARCECRSVARERGSTRQAWRAITCSTCVCCLATANCRSPFAVCVTFRLPGCVLRRLASSTSLCAAQLESRFGHAGLQISLRKTARRGRTISRCYQIAWRGCARRRLGNRSDLRREMSRSLFDVSQSIASVERSEIRRAAGRIARCG